MRSFAKVGLTAAAIGGALLMAAPVAMAGDLSGGQGIAGVSFQVQDGSEAGGGVTLNQSSALSVGQLQAESYYNNVTNNGFDGTLYTTNSNQGSQYSTSEQWLRNYGDTTTTSARDLSQQTSTLTQTQSQVIGYDGTGGFQMQGGGALALQGNNCFWNTLFGGFYYS